MTTGLRLSVAALALAGTSLFASVPASADSFYGPRGGIGFSYESGGYCDSSGCPEDFWQYPIAYCPVYFDGEWYRGPFYYRYWQGDYYYWIRGDWRLDEWSGGRPDDACVGRYGPPRDYYFYIDNGFIWLDAWRWRFFHHHHDHDHDGDHDHDHDHHHWDHGHGTWDHGGDHGVVWDHGGDHNPQASGSPGTPPASGAPTPLGGNGSGANSERGVRDHFRGDESGPRHHEGGPAAPNSDFSGNSGGSGGHHFDGGARNAPAAVSSPPPSPPPPPNPPPPPPAPSSGESHHDSGFHGDFGHHAQKP